MKVKYMKSKAQQTLITIDVLGLIALVNSRCPLQEQYNVCLPNYKTVEKAQSSMYWQNKFYGIPVKLVKLVRYTLSEPLNMIFDQPFARGIFPGKLHVSLQSIKKIQNLH